MSKWKVDISIKFRDSTEAMMNEKEIAALARSENPLEFFKELAETRGKEFDSMAVNMQKTDFMTVKDIRRL